MAPAVLLTRKSRVKKKSDTGDVDPEAAAAVLGTVVPAAEPIAAAEGGEGAEGKGIEVPEEQEENIYEVMKAHMRRQKEELDAKNAAMRAQQRAGGMGVGQGRPGPMGSRPVGPVPQAAMEIEKVADVTDLGAVWSAARRHLNGAARYLESVLGHCCRVESLNAETGETVLSVPKNQGGFTNEKARAKIEESLRAVTGLGIRLTVHVLEEESGPQPGEGSRAGNMPGAPAATAQRVPPEVIEAVKAQPVVQELMKRLDASVVHVEMLNTDE